MRAMCKRGVFVPSVLVSVPQRELRPGRQLSPASDCLGRVWVELFVFFPSQL